MFGIDPQVLLLIGGLVAFIAAFAAVALLIQHRNACRARKIVVDMGGEVLQIEHGPQGRESQKKGQYVFARYVTAQGEIRQAAFDWRARRVLEDRPYHHAMKDRYRPASDLLNWFIYQAEVDKLPGRAILHDVVRDLATSDAGSVTVEDTPDAPRRLAPLLQYIEALKAVDDEGDPQVLNLVLKGKWNLVLRWELQPGPPRQLRVDVLKVTQNSETTSA